MSSLDETLFALSDPTRRKVIDLLRLRARRAGEIADELSMTPAAMSRHLRVLRTTGLVEEDHGGADARVRVYQLKQERFAELRRWIEDVETFWQGELASFKQYAERTRGAGSGRPDARAATRTHEPPAARRRARGTA